MEFKNLFMIQGEINIDYDTKKNKNKAGLNQLDFIQG